MVGDDLMLDEDKSQLSKISQGELPSCKKHVDQMACNLDSVVVPLCLADGWCQESMSVDLDSIITNKFDRFSAIPRFKSQDVNVYQLAARFNSSPLKPHVFKIWLTDYDIAEKTLLLSDLTIGVRIPSTKPPPTSYDFYNHPSALANSDKVTDHIKQGVLKGIFAGPFERPPPELRVSPLAAIPQKDSPVIRLIHNLSFPNKNSVNSHIPRECCRVYYETLDDCLAIITRLGKNSLIAKADLASAYHCINICCQDYQFLGFTWKNHFYFGKTLPMGSGISCARFEGMSKAVQWILQAKLGVKDMSHILDDFIFFGPAKSPICDRALKTFMTLLDSLGWLIKHSKTVQPGTKVELHGIMVNTVTTQLSIPEDKIKKAVILIDELLGMQKATLRQLQSVAGLLSFFTRALPGARVFIRRLFDIMHGASRPSHRIRILASTKADLVVWKKVLQMFNGYTLISHVYWSSSPDWRVYSDASGVGYAALFGSYWFQGKFPTSWLEYSIAIKEFVPVYIAMHLWIKYFSNSNIVFFIDNESVVNILLKQTSPDKIIMKMLRKLVVSAMLNNVVFTSKHIRGKHNVLTDHLSRFQFGKAKKWAPWLQDIPVKVPASMLPW